MVVDAMVAARCCDQLSRVAEAFRPPRALCSMRNFAPIRCVSAACVACVPWHRQARRAGLGVTCIAVHGP